MQHVAFRCGSCGLSLEADVGADRDHLVRAFWCPKEAKPYARDVSAPDFKGRCVCGAQLELLADFPLDACPKCYAPSGVEKTPRHGTSISREGGTGR